MANIFNVSIHPSTTNLRHYVIKCTSPLKIIDVIVQINKKTFDVYYTYENKIYDLPITINNDEIRIDYCQLSDDKSKIYVGFIFIRCQTSLVDKIEINFEDLFNPLHKHNRLSNRLYSFLNNKPSKL